MSLTHTDTYSAVQDQDITRQDDGVTEEASDARMKAGQSRRIYNELYKVIPSERKISIIGY